MPRTIAATAETATRRFLEFFAAAIRNRTTSIAYYRTVPHFFARCGHQQPGSLDKINSDMPGSRTRWRSSPAIGSW